MVEGNNKYGKFLDDVPRLLKIVKGAGFEQCCEDLISSDRVAKTREQANEVEQGALEAAVRTVTQGDPDNPWTEQQVDSLIKDCHGELEDVKVYYRWDMHIVTGRRPASQ